MNEDQIKRYYEKKTNKKIIEDNCKTEYKKAVLENKKRLFPEFLEIKSLKRQLKEPAIRRRISNTLLLLAIIMTAITTLTTIAGGLRYRNTLFTMITFISFVTFEQLTILIISCLKPYLYSKAPRYIGISTLLQLFLLIVSISFNFVFLYNPLSSGWINLLNIILCIIFDVVILLICEISFVIRLNIQFSQANNRIKNILKMVMDNKLNKIESKINNNNLIPVIDIDTDKENIKEIEYKKDTEIEENQENNSNVDMDRNVNEELENNNDSKVLEMSDFVQDKDRGLIKSTILNYQDNNICPSTSALMDLTGLSKNKIIAVKKELETDGMIETVGNKTFLKSVEV
jgi:hypothetical protein